MLKTMNTKTEITGRTARTATGVCNDGKRRTFAVGQTLSMSTAVAAGDGGELNGRYDVEIIRLGVGTEYGMLRTTAIAEVRFTGRRPVDDYGCGNRVERPETLFVAVRHLVP